MIFKPLSKLDLAMVYQIDKQSNRSPWTLHDYQESYNNDNHYLIGLFDGNNLIGTCVYSLVLDEVEILQIVIDKTLQGHGYGYLLLQYVCNTVKSAHAAQIFLEVMVGNTAAINLYHKLGFNIVGKRKNYYRVDGIYIDAILMAKTLFNFDLDIE